MDANDPGESGNFDVGPLGWVKGEIDLALERASAALARFAANNDATELRFCRTHVHQVQGALTIVGVDGVTQFAEALEALLENAERGGSAVPVADTVTLAQRAIAAIGHRLDALIAGAPNQPLRLLPLYRELAAACGKPLPSPTDLFFPDLSLRLPQRGTTPPLADAQRQLLLRRERGRFQRGLIAFLRAPRDPAGAAEMRAAAQRIENTQDGAARSFWRVAGAFLTALGAGALPAALDVRPLLSRIDLQIRRQQEGSNQVAERLLRDTLYHVAIAASDDPAVREVKAAYRLSALLPAAEDGNAAAPEHHAARLRLREAALAAEESWSRLCAGAGVLPRFREHAAALATAADALGNTDCRRLTQSIVAAGNWLADDGRRRSEALAMEVATAILLVQNAQEIFPRLDADFRQQVDVMVARVHACLAENPLPPPADVPTLDAMSRRAQERLLVAQVAREIKSNLGGIEQTLDAFFRDPERRPELAALDAPLKQVAGALTMMRHDAAADLARQCAADITAFADFTVAGTAATPADYERVAERLSLLGFFVDALAQGGADFGEFVRQLQKTPATAADGDAGATSGDDTVEQQIERQQRETQALLSAHQQKPADAGLREELRQSLSALQNDADLVANPTLGEQTKVALSALDALPQITGDAAGAQAIDARITVVDTPPSAAPPSPETLQLSQASNEEIDAELLAIFIEEAQEVLAGIADNASRLPGDGDGGEALTAIRRAFHTLKGSGRMVGLRDLGDTAWAIEQTLNLWLRQELAQSPPLLELIDAAHATFGDWVEHLAGRRSQAPDTRSLLAQAAALRPGNDRLAAIGVDAPAAPVPPFPSVPAEPIVHTGDAVATERAEPATASAEIIALEPFRAERDARRDAPGEVTTAATAAPAAAANAPEAPDAGGEAEDEAAGGQQRIKVSSSLWQIFVDEAKQHLATLEREFADLCASPGAPGTAAFHRAAHTLGGIAGTVGLPAINRLGLALEHALLRRQNAADPDQAGALELIRASIAELGAMLATIARDQAPTDAPSLVDALDALYPAAALATVFAVDSGAAEPAAGEHAAGSAGVAEGSRAQLLRDDFDEQLLPVFLEEADDLESAIAAALRAFRAAPGESEAAHALARLLHTLKGSARMAGAMTIGEFTHAIETRVEALRHGGTTSGDGERIDAIAEIDEIESAIDGVEQLIDELRRGETVSPAPAAALTAAPAAPGAGDDPRERRRRARGDEAAVQRASVRVRADLIDRLVNEAGELSIARTRIEGEIRSLKESLLELTESVIRLRRQLREVDIQAETQMASGVVPSSEDHSGFDALEFDRFTRFQEVTRMMAETVNDVATVQQQLLRHVDDADAALLAQARLNRTLQQELLDVRKAPFDSLGDRLYRIVRQTAKELGRRANLDLRGGRVEIDRSVLDKLASPLEHLLRNAIAHGIEPADERRARGKSEIGEIRLALTQEGNEVLLTLADDGRGIDFASIRERALAGGLLAAGAPDDEAGLVELIFKPGFTTAELSQVAGRGVGLDVVKTEIAHLGGRIEVESDSAQGTTFRLYVPLTLALTQALLVRAGGATYAVPSTMIEQALDLKAPALARIRTAGAAEWMGKRYPFRLLGELLGSVGVPGSRRKTWVLLLKSGAQRVAVEVEEVRGAQEIVVKNIGPQLSRIVGIDGATVLGDGQIVLILNPVALAGRPPLVSLAAPAAAANATDSPAAAATVMVVDDSLTVRKITGRLLEREGYRVLTARDGVDALEQLLDVVPAVLLVDIEMPRMDGFDFTRNVRGDARLKDVPIVMITSRTADKHRQYAAGIGVDRYFGKPYQEDELLQTVADFVRLGRQPQETPA